jgi:Ca2+-binding EF-hand superfamily protein
MTKFIDIIYEYATETESDQILRRLANAAANNLNVNLRESLDLHDLEGNGLLEKADLKRSLKNCHIPVSDNELEIIYKEIGGKIAPKDDNDDR